MKITQDNIPVVFLFHLLRLSDVEALATLLKRFLGLEQLRQRRHQEEEAEYGEEEEDSLESSDSEDEATGL